MRDADDTAHGQLTDVLNRLKAIIQRLPAAEDSLAAYQQRADRYLTLETLYKTLSQMHESLQAAYLDLEAAAGIVDSDQPVDVIYGTGRPWAGPQPPEYLLRLADRAADGTARGTTSYRKRLSDTQLTEAMDPACSHMSYGRSCTSPRVNRADGTRAAACWPHLAPEQKEQITAERSKAIAANACTECGAAAGEKCVQDGQPGSIHRRRLHALHEADS